MILRGYRRRVRTFTVCNIFDLFIQISMDDVLEGYPPPKAVMDKKRHIFTTEDKTVADDRASQVHCKKPELARKDTYIGVWNQRNRFPNSNQEKKPAFIK